MIKACIFDLDGVLTDTAHFHFIAWKEIAREVGYELTIEKNEELKGVSREDSLRKILFWAQAKADPEQFKDMMYRKNEHYLKLIEEITENDLFEGVAPFLKELKIRGIKIGLGSSSKNAKPILAKLGILPMFDAIADGTNVTISKPHPEVFLKAATLLEAEPQNCLVFEDAPAGVQAALAAGMKVVGIGDSKILAGATWCFPDMKQMDIEVLKKLPS